MAPLRRQSRWIGRIRNVGAVLPILIIVASTGSAQETSGSSIVKVVRFSAPSIAGEQTFSILLPLTYETRHFIMRSRRASRGSARPLNCGVRPSLSVSHACRRLDRAPMLSLDR